MTRFHHRLPAFLLLLVFFLSACQPGLPTLPFLATPTGTPAQTADPMPAGTATPATTFTPEPTRPGHLEVDAQNLDGATILFWHPFGGGGKKAIEDIIRQFNQDNEWGIHVESTAAGSSGMLSKSLDTAIAERTLPNVVAAPAQQLLDWQETYNIIINLNDYLQDPIVGFTPQERADIPLTFLKQDQANGRQLGIPAQRTVQMLFYNQTWAEELGFRTPPTTPEELMKQACAAADANHKDDLRDNDGTGGWIINTNPEAVLSWMAGFGLEAPEEFGAEGYTFNNRRFKEGFAFLRKMIDEGCAWPGRKPTPYEYFANRYTLFYSASLEDLPQQERAMQHSHSSDQWIVLPYPGNAQKPIVITTGLSYAILVDSPEKQLAAWHFIHWLIQPKRQVEMVKNSGAWPASVTALESLQAYRQMHPQWNSTLAWIPIAQTAPHQSDWMVVRNILSDATWQIFQANMQPEDIPSILRQLDQTVVEVLRQKRQTP